MPLTSLMSFLVSVSSAWHVKQHNRMQASKAGSYISFPIAVRTHLPFKSH
jgi:hypothetical protein